MNNIGSATQFIKILTNISFDDILKLNNIQKVVRLVGKIILKTLWNIIVFAFILMLFPIGIVTNDIAYTVLFNTFLYPLVLLLLAYHVYNCITYYIYCFKHRGEQIYFTNRYKSKVKTVISIVCLIGVILLSILYTVSVGVFYTKLDGESTKSKEEVEFIESEISDYSFVEYIEVSTEKELQKGKDYSFLSMYVVSGNLSVRESITKDSIAKIYFEYGKKLPFYVSSFIYKDKVDSLSTKISYYVEGGDNYETTHNETKIDGIKIVYRYIECERNNFIDVCMQDGNKVLYIEENWEPYIEIEPETRINEWVEIFEDLK